MEVWLWVIILILAVVVEMSTTQLVCIWFAGGALVGLVAHFLHAPLWLQVILAAAVTLILLISTRPFVRRFLAKKETPTNADRVIGQIGIVTERIDNITEQGRITVLGGDWRARSLGGEPIESGARVKVEKIEGVKLIVTRE